MDNTLLNIGGHGLGDCILSLQISYLLSLKNIKHKNLISTRKEVYEPLYNIFANEFDFERIDENYSENNQILFNDKMQNELKERYGSNYITYNVPDLLFRNPLAFTYKEYGLNPDLIKKTRTLAAHFKDKENIIYCGLCSTTSGYVYKDIPNLLIFLAEFLPDYRIYFPLVESWDKKIENLGDFNKRFPNNVIIDNNPSFINSLNFLTKSVYGIFTCNGPSHIAYQLGIPRLILDPQYGRLPWMARWKENFEECIPINSDINSIVNIVYNNLNFPETTLLDRKIILNLINSGYNNWKEILALKF